MMRRIHPKQQDENPRISTVNTGDMLSIIPTCIPYSVREEDGAT
jgi:hypothetical protein